MSTTLVQAPDYIDSRKVYGLLDTIVVLAREDEAYRVTVEQAGEHLFTIKAATEAEAWEAWMHPFANRPADAPDPWTGKP